MRVYSIIPARSGSKGVSDKNIKNLNGKPLLFYSIEASISANKIDKTIVTTDSLEYKKLVENNYDDIEVIIRPESISCDTASDIHYILHAIYTLNMCMDDKIVILRPTTPIRESGNIDSALNSYVNEEYESLRSVHKIKDRKSVV